MKLIVASYQEMDSIVQTSTQSFFGKRNFKKKKKEAEKEVEEATHGQEKNLNNEEAEKRSDVANDSQTRQGSTGMYTLVVPSLSTKFIKNSHQNLPV